MSTHYKDALRGISSEQHYVMQVNPSVEHRLSERSARQMRRHHSELLHVHQRGLEGRLRPVVSSLGIAKTILIK